MAKKEMNVLTEAYLNELYNAAIENDYMCSVVVQYMKDEYLPSRDYQMLHNGLKQHFSQYKRAPKYGVIAQKMATSRSVTELLDEIRDTATNKDTDSIRDQFEEFLKLVEFKKIYKLIGDKFNNENRVEALQMFQEQSQKMQMFSLKPETFIDVAGTFEQRLNENKERTYAEDGNMPVNSFYIDCLDNLNQGRNLRTQLTVWMAMSGVGKSHVARWIGYNGAYVSGLNVLHIQLEGSANETLDAYSATLIGQSAFAYETGDVNTHSVEMFIKQSEQYKGSLKVKAYSKFGQKRTTNDIKAVMDDYKKNFGFYPDICVIDSLDLLLDSTGRSWNKDSLRFLRIAVAEELKDLAAETNCWMNATYQATIESRQWANDEKNVLDGYNLSEAKGLQRPCTHLISLNRSDRESEEETMRLHVAKSRFFRKGGTYRIATDYDHERFYDRERTLSLSQK